MFNLGGGEIILILAVLFILAVVALGFAGLVLLIVRAAASRPPSAPVVRAPPVMNPQQQQRDLEHLNLLSIFHFVFAGVGVLGIAFLGVHYTIMHAVLTNPAVWKSQPPGPPPQVFLNVFVWFYLFTAVLLLAGMTLNVLSGLFLRQRTHRTFSFVVAALNCLQIPFGTALGVFTLLVLCRDGVRQLYSGQTLL